MKTRHTLSALILAVSLATGHAGLAQDATKPAADATAPAATDTTTTAPAADGTAAQPDALSLGTEDKTTEVGKNYTREAFGDWNLNCTKTADGKNEPCQLYQLLHDKDGNAVAEVNLVSLPAGGEAVAGATIITPLETLLTEQLRLTIDAGKTKRYPFNFCTAIGCISRVGFTGDELAAMKKGAKANIVIVPVAAPDKTVSVDVSLKGLTAGLDAVTAANAWQKP